MLFNSLDFIIFFPVVALLYFVIPAKGKNVWLLLADRIAIFVNAVYGDYKSYGGII